MDVVAFQLGSARYGLALGAVQEVLRAVAITPLPGSPEVVEGVIDVRGTLVPVFDARKRFGLPARVPDPAERLVLARSGGRTVALRVDDVPWLGAVDAAALQEARRALPQADYVAGVARLADGLVLIHDLETFLSPPEAEALDRALHPAGTAEANG